MKAQEFSLHRAQVYRLLISLLDNPEIAPCIGFKGGTCAAMLGYLDRFSVDLDFDNLEKTGKKELRKKLRRIFKNVNLEIKDESKNALQFFLRYEAPPGQRNTLKLEILDKKFIHNIYKPQYLSDIDRFALCQTMETMFANKLVALLERFETTGSIAGRDIYDIHHFFYRGFHYEPLLISERRKVNVYDFFRKLKQFVSKKVTQRLIDQDINALLPYNKFTLARKMLKPELLLFIDSELKNLSFP